MKMDVRIVAQGRDYLGVPAEQIRRAVEQGRIAGHDLVRFSGSPTWIEIAHIPELAALLPGAQPGVVPQAAPPTVAAPRGGTPPSEPAPVAPTAAWSSPPPTGSMPTSRSR